MCLEEEILVLICETGDFKEHHSRIFIHQGSSSLFASHSTKLSLGLGATRWLGMKRIGEVSHCLWRKASRRNLRRPFVALTRGRRLIIDQNGSTAGGDFELRQTKERMIGRKEEGTKGLWLTGGQMNERMNRCTGERINKCYTKFNYIIVDKVVNYIVLSAREKSIPILLKLQVKLMIGDYLDGGCCVLRNQPGHDYAVKTCLN
ncbi:Protein of unknown function [Gryllus bimaculatus]|nr:Protein of unknown function [Gryllus bimaculatus]